ncbi:response regulator transcription factor [Sphingobium aquiterrae]|uniref:response regulator transcription factor n=1 Tax=Sphingobium aquiterrae TaxID=2038656 RepID=UPI003018D97B
MTRKILLVEDDTATADFLATGLADAGYAVDWQADGRNGLARALHGDHVAIILDRMVPGMDGIALLTALREAGRATPVIILSAIGSTDERVKGLKAGSDDYLVKPFALSELLARLEVLLRRTAPGAQPAVTRLFCDDLTMDLLSSRVERAGRAIALQPREFRLLEFLMRNQGTVVTRTMILEEVWCYDFDPGTNVIDVHISNLRKKIDGPGMPLLLHTVRGAGYRLGTAA